MASTPILWPEHLFERVRDLQDVIGAPDADCVRFFRHGGVYRFPSPTDVFPLGFSYDVGFPVVRLAPVTGPMYQTAYACALVPTDFGPARPALWRLPLVINGTYIPRLLLMEPTEDVVQKAAEIWTETLALRPGTSPEELLLRFASFAELRPPRLNDEGDLGRLWRQAHHVSWHSGPYRPCLSDLVTPEVPHDAQP